MDAWPANRDDDAYSRVPDSDTPTLLIGGTLDGSTPPGAATRDLLPHLRNGRQMVLAELGHTTDFWTYQPAASTRLVTRFLDSGRVDASLYRRHVVDFDPPVRQPSLAKAVAAFLVGLPLLAALALAVVVRRVRRRGRLRRWAGGAVRALLAPVLGLAGWVLAVVVVLAMSLTVALDDAGLVMVAVALPVPAAVYWGWADRRCPRRTRRTGLVAALAGAVAGAWLGFGAGAGLLTIVTATAGAVAVANLALIALDVGVRPAREPVTAPVTRSALRVASR